jgi:hypothetical protein
MRTHFKTKTRGQVLVLGCVAMLLTAIMLMASFTLASSVHERIRIQAHSDAQAYSLATVEARAFNTMAYYNRSIAAAMVAQMSLHSWMAIATTDVAMLQAGMIMMIANALEEMGMGCNFWNASHCACMSEAFFSAFKFFQAWRQWANTLSGLENQFNKGVEALQKMVSSLHNGQNRVLRAAQGELHNGSVMQALWRENASGSLYLAALSGNNNQFFTCALEGSSLDATSGCPGGTSSTGTRAHIISEAANAAKPRLDLGTASSLLLNHDNFKGPTDPDVPDDALTNGTFGVEFGTAAGVAANAQSTYANQIGPAFATITGFRHTTPKILPIGGSIRSGQPNGHSGFGHQGSHPYEPCPGSDCFVNFRANSSAANDFNQPTVYGGVIQNLRLYADSSGKQFYDRAPWQVNQNGEIRIEYVEGAPTKVKLVPRNTGVALSKAKTYFHQMGRWQVAPNFFDPFWRAKLHFFSRNEMRSVLPLTGDQNGMMLLGAGAPVEGSEQ